MEALIGGAFVAEMGGVLEDARIEAQAAWRKQGVRIAQVSQDVLPEAQSGRGRHQRGQQVEVSQGTQKRLQMSHGSHNRSTIQCPEEKSPCRIES